MCPRNLFIVLLLFLCGFLYAGGQAEEAVLEAQALMELQAENDEEKINNNIQAAEILEELILGYSASGLVSDQQFSDTRMLLAEAYKESRQFEKAIIVLADVMVYHNDRFNEAEAKIAEIRAIRDRYNELLGLFLVEIQKSPNDPDDPFDEVSALDYINEMEGLVSIQVPGTAAQVQDNGEPAESDGAAVSEGTGAQTQDNGEPGEPDIAAVREGIRTGIQIQENRVRVKLAVDRGYRDRILQLAHQLITEGEYIAAMDRYLNIEDIDTKDFYEDSFDLQKEEFLELGLPDVFINQIQSLTEQIKILNSEFAEDNAILGPSVQVFLSTAVGFFPDNPLDIPENVIALASDFQSSRTSISQVDRLFTDLTVFVTALSEIEQVAAQIVALRDELPAFLPSETEDQDSEYLAYLEQFIAGPLQYEREGIQGAALRQSRVWADQLRDFFLEAVNRYTDNSDTAYETSDYNTVPTIENSIQISSELLFTLFSFISQGSILDREDPLAYVELLQEDDRREAARILLERERIAGRVEMSRFALRHENLTGEQYAQNTEALNAYNSGLDFLSEVEDYSDNVQITINTLAENLSDYALPLSATLDQHNQDRNALVGDIQDTIIDYFNQYIALEQDSAPQRYAQASSEIEEGNRELAGIEGTTLVEGVETNVTRYYPEQARDGFLAAREDLTAIITISERLLDLINASPVFVQNSEELSAVNAVSSQIIDDSRSFLGELDPVVNTASARVEEAELLISDARLFRNDFTTASNQRDYDSASEFFVAIDRSYTDSLNINYREDLLAERESVLSTLSQELADLLFEIVSAEKTAALERVVVAVEQRDYFTARDALQDALAWDEQLPTPPDPTIIAFENEIERAIILSDQRDIPAINDSRYSRITNDLNEAGKSLIRAQSASERNNARLLREEIAKSRSFISSVRDQLPSNFEAAFIELQLIQLEDPDGFDDYFEDQINEVEILVYGSNRGSFGTGDYSEYSLFEKDQLLSSIEALNQLRQNARLERLIIDIEVDLGRRESPELVAARNRGNALANQGESLIASARQESNPTSYESLLNQALATLRQAQAVFPRIPRLPSLISEAEVLLGLEVTVNLPFEANQLFEQAAALFANQDLIAAKRLLDALWANAAYRSYFPLKDLISELYNLLGQNLPGV